MLETHLGKKDAWLKDGQRRRASISTRIIWKINWVGVQSCYEGRLRVKGTIGEKSLLVDEIVAFMQAHSSTQR